MIIVINFLASNFYVNPSVHFHVSLITQRFGCATNLRPTRHDVNVENPTLEEFSRRNKDRSTEFPPMCCGNRINSRFHKLPIGIRRKHPDTPETVDLGSEFVAQLLSLNVLSVNVLSVNDRKR